MIYVEKFTNIEQRQQNSSAVTLSHPWVSCPPGGLLNLTTSNHNLQDPYCCHCHTYTNELLLLDLSSDSIGPGSCESDCVMA